MTLDKQVFYPELSSVLDTDHLHPQPMVHGQSAEGTGENEVGLEHLASLERGVSATSKGEYGILCKHQCRCRACAAELRNRFLCGGRTKVVGDAEAGDEGQNGKPWKRTTGPDATRAHLGSEAVSALVDSLNAVFRFEASTQRRQALGNTVGGDMDIAPERLAQLCGGHDAACIGQQEPKRSKFFGGQVNRRFSAEEGAVNFQAEAGKRNSRPIRAKSCGITLVHPNQRSSSDNWLTSPPMLGHSSKANGNRFRSTRALLAAYPGKEIKQNSFLKSCVSMSTVFVI